MTRHLLALMVMSPLFSCGRRVMTKPSAYTLHMNSNRCNHHFNRQHTRGCISSRMRDAQLPIHHLVLTTSPKIPSQGSQRQQTLLTNHTITITIHRHMLIRTSQFTLHLILHQVILLNLNILVSLHQFLPIPTYLPLVPPPLGWGVKLVQKSKNPFSRIQQDQDQHHQKTETYHQYNHHQVYHQLTRNQSAPEHHQHEEEEVKMILMLTWIRGWMREK